MIWNTNVVTETEGWREGGERFMTGMMAPFNSKYLLLGQLAPLTSRCTRLYQVFDLQFGQLQ